VLLLVFLPVLHGALRRVAIGVAVLMVLGIGLSRVALGVHYVSDVLAGYVLGGVGRGNGRLVQVWRRQDGLTEARAGRQEPCETITHGGRGDRRA